FWPPPILPGIWPWTRVWGISCAISWTYAFLSTLSAAQSLGYCGARPAGRIRSGDSASLTALEYGYKKFDVPPVPSLNEQSRPMTSNRPNQGLAAMPPQGRPAMDGRGRAGDASLDERRQREALASEPTPRQSYQGQSY